MQISSLASCSIGQLHAPLHRAYARGWKVGFRLLNQHTDLVSSVGILAVTTCLLASKIFKQIPLFISRASFVVLNFGGVIWLNVQVRDFIKTIRDVTLAIQVRDRIGMVLTAARVMLKAANILMTCGFFAAAVASMGGITQATMMLYAALLPIAIFSFGVGICSDLTDYFINKRLLGRLKKVQEDPFQVREMMRHFVALNHSQETSAKNCEAKRFSVEIIRQIQTPVLETFQEKFLEKKPMEEDFEKLYNNLCQSVQDKQTGTESNLFLFFLGYACMGVSRIFPGSTADISVRWVMSVLYTDELIRQKLFQYDLSQELQTARQL